MEIKVCKLERKLRVKYFLCYFKEFILLFFRVSAEIIEFSIRYPKTGFVFRQDTETVRRSDCYFYRHQRSDFKHSESYLGLKMEDIESPVEPPSNRKKCHDY